MKKKSYISTKFIILIPVFILGFVSVVSNILAVTNIKRVNANATQIANGYMSCISELGDIQKETLLIHRLGLSHIVATDLNTMISLVETIRSEQETLETYLDDFQEYVTDDNKAEYDALVSNYEGMKYELANLMAYSANNDNEAAYALANGKIADYSSAMQESIAAIRTNVSENADVAKEQLAAVYRTAIAASTASIIISVAALLATLICVFRLVIIPLLKTQKEITDIIEDIDKREGDLTRRVSVHANQEVGGGRQRHQRVYGQASGYFQGDREQFNQNGICGRRGARQRRDIEWQCVGSVGTHRRTFCHDGGDVSQCIPHQYEHRVCKAGS